MVDLIELAIYGERVIVGGIEMVPDEDGNLYSLETLEDKLRTMIPGGHLNKRIAPRRKPIQMVATTTGRVSAALPNIANTPQTQLQPGTFQRPVLENPYAKTESS